MKLRRSRIAGFSLMELIVATLLITLAAISSTRAMLSATRIAARNRVLTAARTIVQRNLDNALSLRWDRTTVPGVLAVTAAGGEAWDDDTEGGTGQVAVVIEDEGPGMTQTVPVPGVLTRIVEDLKTQTTINPENAEIRRITFRLNFTYRNQPFVVQMSAMRAMDF